MHDYFEDEMTHNASCPRVRQRSLYIPSTQEERSKEGRE